MKIKRLQSGTYCARFYGFVATGPTIGQAFNNLVTTFHGAIKNGNNTVPKAENRVRIPAQQIRLRALE